MQAGLDQVDRDVDTAPRGVGIRAQLVRRAHKSLGSFALQPRQTDVETGREAVSAAKLYPSPLRRHITPGDRSEN